MGYVEYLGDAIKIWSQTGSGKLSKFGAKNGVKLDKNWVKPVQIRVKPDFWPDNPVQTGPWARW
jgi:hypothetical protein